ncbi:MAG: co-chaperone YbbN [Rhodobacteraceae bacterium]|nr:co-chaperone YbbN [Paracoccaceae bacterium]
MLDLNNPSTESFVKEGSTETFMADVVEESKTTPLLAYFTASWCGPCKTMGPIIESAVNKTRGKIKLVRLDVDANQNIAAQLRIQSIPTVYVFMDGQPVDGFTGAKTAAEIEKFLAEIVKKSGGTTVEEILEEANELLASGGVAEASQIFATVLQDYPENPIAYAGLISCHIFSDNLDQAEAMLQAVPPAIANSREINGVRSNIELKRQAKASGPTHQLAEQVRNNPDDLQGRFDLAIALYSNDQVQEGIDELLEIFRRDQEWNDGAAKEQLLKIFSSLKPEDPIALKGRRKLSSLIFS